MRIEALFLHIKKKYALVNQIYSYVYNAIVMTTKDEIDIMSP